MKDRGRTLTLFERVQHWITEPPPDQVFEITENSLAAVSPRSPSQHQQEVLSERALAPSPAAPNFLKPQLYRDALAKFGSNAGGKGNRAAALVVPDYAARMAILDFEEFPAGDEERAALIRFRLRKTVPFHIDEAQLSYAVQVNDAKRIEVLAVTIARPILDEYEALFIDSGYRLGLVTPSSLATLRLCGSDDKSLTLLAKAAGSCLSVLLLEQDRVRLVRCLDLAGSDGEVHEREEQAVLPLLQQTLAYAEDQVGQPVGRLLLCGFGAAAERLGMLAQNEFGIPYALVRSRFGATSQENAGLMGLLEQYAA